MNKKFTLGVLAGMSSLALAVPVLAQITNAASATTTSTTSASARIRPEFKQPTLQEMIDNDTTLLANIDTMVASLKTATQAHKNALTAAASLTGTPQTDAIKKAQDDFRAAMQAAMKDSKLKGFMMPFGGPGGPHGGPGGKHFGKGPGLAGLATKLGMTEADLKAALDGGKTIQQIATEKGVTLPAPPVRGGHHEMENDGDEDDVTTTTQNQ